MVAEDQVEVAETSFSWNSRNIARTYHRTITLIILVQAMLTTSDKILAGEVDVHSLLTPKSIMGMLFRRLYLQGNDLKYFSIDDERHCGLHAEMPVFSHEHRCITQFGDRYLTYVGWI